MKEFSIKEKAKRYDKALEIAREWYNDPHITIGLKGNLEDMFPELKESEDERIRKAIIEYFENCNIKHSDWIAWLEKQSKQKPSKDEPKFKVGDIL